MASQFELDDKWNILLVKSIDFQELINWSGILLTKMFHLTSNSNYDAIFMFPGVNIFNFKIKFRPQIFNLQYYEAETLEADCLGVLSP